MTVNIFNTLISIRMSSLEECLLRPFAYFLKQVLVLGELGFQGIFCLFAVLSCFLLESTHRERQRQRAGEEKAPLPTENGHAAITSPFLPPVRILGMHSQAPSKSLNSSRLEYELWVWPHET